MIKRVDTMQNTMKIKALVPWFGSKRRLAPHIVAALGEHRAYWEPFCGSMAVLLAKPPCTIETANDLHGGLINLAKVIQSKQSSLALYKRLRRTLVTEQIYADSDAFLRCALLVDSQPAFGYDVAYAYHYFVASWLGRNGFAGIANRSKSSCCVRYTASGGSPSTRWQSAVNSIPAWRKRMRNVTILNRNGFNILERIGDEDKTAIYVDPPYFEKGAQYQYDFTQHDHERLASLLHRFKKARVVVSYYDHSMLAELYPEWRHLHIDVPAVLCHGNRRGKSNARATEVLLINNV